MRIAGDLTVVGAPVVNAACLSSAPAGKTVLNQQAHERIASHYGAFCSTSEMELDIKHQGRVLVHEVKLKKLSFVPSDPALARFESRGMSPTMSFPAQH
jgi:hypothetical protein